MKNLLKVLSLMAFLGAMVLTAGAQTVGKKGGTNVGQTPGKPSVETTTDKRADDATVLKRSETAIPDNAVREKPSGVENRAERGETVKADSKPKKAKIKKYKNTPRGKAYGWHRKHDAQRVDMQRSTR